jgi:hypothetical protein
MAERAEESHSQAQSDAGDVDAVRAEMSGAAPPRKREGGKAGQQKVAKRIKPGEGAVEPHQGKAPWRGQAAEEASSARRSGRVRLKPVAYWKGEKARACTAPARACALRRRRRTRAMRWGGARAQVVYAVDPQSGAPAVAKVVLVPDAADGVVPPGKAQAKEATPAGAHAPATVRAPLPERPRERAPQSQSSKRAQATKRSAGTSAPTTARRQRPRGAAVRDGRAPAQEPSTAGAEDTPSDATAAATAGTESDVLDDAVESAPEKVTRARRSARSHASETGPVRLTGRCGDAQGIVTAGGRTREIEMVICHAASGIRFLERKAAGAPAEPNLQLAKVFR